MSYLISVITGVLIGLLINKMISDFISLIQKANREYEKDVWGAIEIDGLLIHTPQRLKEKLGEERYLDALLFASARFKPGTGTEEIETLYKDNPDAGDLICSILVHKEPSLWTK